MNAISVTMVKGTNSQTMHGYALRLTMAMVTLSWAGWQMLLISGCYERRGFSVRALDFLEGGLVLLFYSLYLLLRLKRKDAAPTRESAQLFFGAFLVALPVVTWAVWMQMARLMNSLAKLTHMYGSNAALLYSCVVVSVIYALVILIWLLTNVSAYDHARSGSLANRIMRRLEVWIIDPYFKK